MKTRITDLLGCQYPVIQGGMAWVAEYHLAASAIPGTFKRTHIPHIESRLQISG